MISRQIYFGVNFSERSRRWELHVSYDGSLMTGVVVKRWKNEPTDVEFDKVVGQWIKDSLTINSI